MEPQIEHRDSSADGAFYVGNANRLLAEMTYRRTGPSIISVDHTEVDTSLRGQGIAQRLLAALVNWARVSDTKVIPLCSFAKSQFDNDPSIRDVLA
ncbi:MAG TPA: GNAT family N-acetyltransferase [Rubrivivax sp.]|nr:GNAT family N-acetyltransferase [Rubrivivax sp.]